MQRLPMQVLTLLTLLVSAFAATDFVCPALGNAATTFVAATYNGGSCAALDLACLDTHAADAGLLAKFKDLQCAAGNDPNVFTEDTKAAHLKLIKAALKDDFANQVFGRVICKTSVNNAKDVHEPDQDSFALYRKILAQKNVQDAVTNLTMKVPCSLELLDLIDPSTINILNLENAFFQGILSIPISITQGFYDELIKELTPISTDQEIAAAVKKVENLFKGDYETPLRKTRAVDATAGPNKGKQLETYADFDARPAGDTTSMVHICQGFRQYFGQEVADAKAAAVADPAALTSQIKLKEALIKYCDNVVESSSVMLILGLLLLVVVIVVAVVAIKMKASKPKPAPRRAATEKSKV